MMIVRIWFTQAFNRIHDINMPVFPNLIDFFIGLDVFRGWSMLPTFFNKMPNLEHITFLDVSICTTIYYDL
ncbi:hypothetical protein Hanom_Chr01g00085081 [Helianthus anomalus]